MKKKMISWKKISVIISSIIILMILVCTVLTATGKLAAESVILSGTNYRVYFDGNVYNEYSLPVNYSLVNEPDCEDKQSRHRIISLFSAFTDVAFGVEYLCLFDEADDPQRNFAVKDGDVFLGHRAIMVKEGFVIPKVNYENVQQMCFTGDVYLEIKNEKSINEIICSIETNTDCTDKEIMKKISGAQDINLFVKLKDYPLEQVFDVEMNGEDSFRPVDFDGNY